MLVCGVEALGSFVVLVWILLCYEFSLCGALMVLLWCLFELIRSMVVVCMFCVV